MELLKSSLENLLEERLVAEAPWMMFRGGFYYLFYSSAWTTEMKYHIRVAISRSPTGPFRRGPTPVITTDWDSMHQVSQTGLEWSGVTVMTDCDWPGLIPLTTSLPLTLQILH